MDTKPETPERQWSQVPSHHWCIQSGRSCL